MTVIYGVTAIYRAAIYRFDCTKDERIKITYEIRNSKIFFLDFLLFIDSTHSPGHNCSQPLEQ